jgi:hypothetical protein
MKKREEKRRYTLYTPSLASAVSLDMVKVNDKLAILKLINKIQKEKKKKKFDDLSRVKPWICLGEISCSDIDRARVININITPLRVAR